VDNKKKNVGGQIKQESALVAMRLGDKGTRESRDTCASLWQTGDSSQGWDLGPSIERHDRS